MVRPHHPASRVGPIVLACCAILPTSTPLAAQSALPGFVVVASTERFTYHSRPGLGVDVARTEGFAAQLEALFGVRPRSGGEYYRHERPEDIAAFTGVYAAGLVTPQLGRVHSTEDFHPHELVHWVAAELGSAGPFFDEGLATALGHNGRWGRRSLDAAAREALGRVEIERVVKRFSSVDPQLAYPIAGAFVASLMDEAGSARVVGFFRACGRGEVAGAAFARVFGAELPEKTQSWAAAARLGKLPRGRWARLDRLLRGAAVLVASTAGQEDAAGRAGREPDGGRTLAEPASPGRHAGAGASRTGRQAGSALRGNRVGEQGRAGK